ncbi:MAG: ABC transporter permease subunit [Anaerolineaceae bacterium]
MNIFLRELRSNLKSLLIWSGILILFNYVGFSKFSAFYGNPQLLTVLDSMPQALISSLNMNAFNLTTVTGFFGIMIIYFNLILSISAAMWGSDIISKEERDRTVEFSLTLPVTRASLVTAKIAAVVVNCIALLLVTWGSTLIFAQKYQPDGEFYHFVSLTMLALLLLQMIFMAFGFFLGCVMKKHKQSGSMAVSILLVSYFISIITGLSKDLDFLKYFTPFKYFDPAALLRESRLEPTFVILSLVLITGSIAGAYISYSKRDLFS